MKDNESFLVITAKVDKQNTAELQEYLGSVMQIFGKNGGKPVARYKVVENIMGDYSPEMIAIISFPDSQSIKDMINGEDYKNLDEMRLRVFDKLNLVICSGL